MIKPQYLQTVEEEIVQWIRSTVSPEKSGRENATVILGISGGKDSTVAAALCREALGSERVLGVIAPDFTDKSTEDAQEVCNYLGIQSVVIPIGLPIMDISKQSEYAGINLSAEASLHLPASVRTVLLYAVARSVNGLVVNTNNLSEIFACWYTRYGNDLGDFSLFQNITCTEVVQLGDHMCLPENMIHRNPSCGTIGKDDEYFFQFSYQQIDQAIRSFGKSGSHDFISFVEEYQDLSPDIRGKIVERCKSLPGEPASVVIPGYLMPGEYAE